jgi:hypothetical protein
VLVGFMAALGAWGAAQGPREVVDPTPLGVPTLDCVVGQALPNPPETAAEGGFTIFYQALGGLATDGRACTVHRVRNAAGGPPTPVRWRAGDDLLIDMARLGRCDADTPCEWFAVARYFAGGFELGPSRLGFGLNADAFEIETQSLHAVTNPDLGGLTASVGTEVEGAIVTADGRSLRVSFTVKSRLERTDGGAMSLIYEVVTTSPELQRAGELALVWQVFDRFPEAAAAAWEDEGSPFIAPRMVRATEGGTIVLGPDSYGVDVAVTGVAYAPDLVMSVVERSNSDVPLLSVPMPAFLPAR